MRVTVTGGTGFLGSHLVRDLLAAGESVRVLARPSPRSDRLMSAGVEIISGDLRDPASLALAVKDADVVYHLAAKVGAAPRVDYFETNVGGTQNLLNACAQNGVGQLVYASSLAVYGPVSDSASIDENTPFDDKPQLRDPYSESKIAADRLVSSVATKTGLPTVILREGIIFGPGRRLPTGIFAFRLSNVDVVFGKPENHFPLNYVENLIDAMRAAAATGTGLREFNILDDDDLTLGQYNQLKRTADGSTTYFASGWPLYTASPFAEALRGIIPMGDTRLSRHQLQRSLQDRRYDTSRIRRETGWTPRVSLAEGIQRTLKGTGPFTSHDAESTGNESSRSL
jgi:nucleoside-diphosphate-sugar epimerase